MAKLPKSQKVKRSHFKTDNEYLAALYTQREGDTEASFVRRCYKGAKYEEKPKSHAKRKQKRHDALVYGMLMHGGYGKVAMYQ